MLGSVIDNVGVVLSLQFDECQKVDDKMIILVFELQDMKQKIANLKEIKQAFQLDMNYALIKIQF